MSAAVTIAAVCECGHDLIIGPADPPLEGSFRGACANGGVCEFAVPDVFFQFAVTSTAPVIARTKPADKEPEGRATEKAKDEEPEPPKRAGR